ncbi:MAG: PilZ domain-containing protein [Myxococcales bacterium]|nr:PilZ domain-containing protein [Myxococcales bacterium]
MTRRNLTPPPDGGGPDTHGTRRQSGGARREASDRVRLYAGTAVYEGWTLNVSRGGVRIIVEDRVELGKDYEISLGDDEHVRRPCRVVWLQEEADGQIAGVQYMDTNAGPPPTGSLPPAPDSKSEPPDGR